MRRISNTTENKIEFYGYWEDGIMIKKMNKYTTEIVKINSIRKNPKNPRIIKDTKFKLLVESIKEFPEMLTIRPVVVNKDGIILAGNMRHKASIEAGLNEIPIMRVDLTPDKENEFLIKDNASFGEWDWEVLANEWDIEELSHWGIDLPIFAESEEELTDDSPKITKKISFEFSFEEADRIESELYNIASTKEQALQILLQK